MSFNITGFDPDTFDQTHSAVHILLLLIFLLPASFLNILCSVALGFARAINWQIKVALINIFAAEIVQSIGASIFYIGHPIRAKHDIEHAYSCGIGLSVVILGFLANTSAVAIYAIAVYVLMKYGPDKLKWWVMAVSVAVPWVLYFCIGLIVTLINSLSLSSSQGFCVQGDEGAAESLSTIAGVILFINMTATCVFAVFTYRLARKGAQLEGNSVATRSITKIVFYHLIKMFVLVVQFLISGVIRVFVSPVNGYNSVIVFLVMHYISDLTINISLILTPIISLIILQPLRDVVRAVRQRFWSCYHQNDVDTAPQNTIETIL
jgi:hypothetical protein